MDDAGRAYPEPDSDENQDLRTNAIGSPCQDTATQPSRGWKSSLNVQAGLCALCSPLAGHRDRSAFAAPERKSTGQVAESVARGQGCFK